MSSSLDTCNINKKEESKNESEKIPLNEYDSKNRAENKRRHMRRDIKGKDKGKRRQNSPLPHRSHVGNHAITCWGRGGPSLSKRMLNSKEMENDCKELLTINKDNAIFENDISDESDESDESDVNDEIVETNNKIDVANDKIDVTIN